MKLRTERFVAIPFHVKRGRILVSEYLSMQMGQPHVQGVETV